MNFDTLQKTINVTFTNQALLRHAFIHRSYLNEDKTVKSSNERLEFLGDAVLQFLSSDFLYESYTQYPEGTLTNIRSGLVKTKTLSEIAKKLGLGELLFLSHGEEESGGRTNPSLLADSFEALLGAMYIDQGIAVCKIYLQTYVFPYAKEIVEKKAFVDFKSKLQEVVQETIKSSPTYRVTRSSGPDHAKIFWVEVVSQGKSLGEGTGKSKQEAEQDAAKNALEMLGRT